MVAVVSENDTQINKHSSPVFLDTGACDSKILSAQSTHPCRQHYSRRAPAGWCAAGQGRTLLGTSLEHSLTEAPPANEGGQISRRFLLLLHRRTALLSETSTAHTNENWAGGALLREAQGKQRIRMVLEVTCAAQHQWGRETGSGRRKAEYPAGVGEHTSHPGTAGVVAHYQILQLLTVTGIVASLLASLKKMESQSHKNNTQKIVKIAVKLSSFFLVLTNLKRKI